MTPQTANHPELEQEQEQIRRVHRALRGAKEAGERAAEAGGDPKAAAALARLASVNAGTFDVPDEHLCVGRVDRADGRQVRVGKRIVYEGDQLLVASWASRVGQSFFEATAEDAKGLDRRLRFELDGLFLRGIEEERFRRARTPTPATSRPAPAPAAPRARPAVRPSDYVPEPAPGTRRHRIDGAPAPRRGPEVGPAAGGGGAGSRPSVDRPDEHRDQREIGSTAAPDQQRPPGSPELRTITVPQVETTDALLRDLARGREPAMRDIVATITAGQYRLIREDREGVLVVQGGPGTGKTAVALHRAAWLLINHREVLEATGVLVVGPNRAFMEYVGQVLPMLGERAVVQREVDHLGDVRRRAPVEDRAVRRVKGSPQMAFVLRRLVSDLVRTPEDGLRFRGPGFDVSVDASTVASLVRRVRARAPGHLEGRSIFERELARTVVAAANVEGTSRASAVASTLQRSDQWTNALARVWPRISARALVHTLYTNARRRNRAAQDVISPADSDLLRRDTGQKLADAAWTSDDLPLIDEVASLLGEASTRYGHVIVDEAQDLSPMQLRMVRRRSRGDLTLVGDLAQATGAWRYAAWDEVTGHLDAGPARIGELTVSYRVPKQAMDLAATVQAQYAPSLLVPNAIRPGAGDVGWRSIPHDGIAAAVASDVAALLAGHAEDRTVGVIVGPGLRQEVSAALEQAGIDFGSVERDGISRSVTVLPAAASKGLEFDHVILADPASFVGQAEQGRDRTWSLPFLFVALTRATQSLGIVFDRELPWPLEAPEGVLPALAPVMDDRTAPVSSALGGRFTEALLWAKLLYERRPRRGRTVPYFGHLMATAATVLDDGGSEDEAIAALLHDVPEDFGHAEYIATIGDRFGEPVRRIVEECGDPAPFDDESWRDQKVRYLEQIEQGSAAARRVALAEKLDNARTLVRDHHRVGAAAYERLGARPADMHWYLESLATLFAREHEGALANEFASLIAELPVIADDDIDVRDDLG